MVSEPLPLNTSCPSPKNTAFMSSLPVVEYVAEDPSARVLLPFTTTNVRLPLLGDATVPCTLIAAPLGLVMLTPFSTIACLRSE